MDGMGPWTTITGVLLSTTIALVASLNGFWWVSDVAAFRESVGDWSIAVLMWGVMTADIVRRRRAVAEERRFRRSLGVGP